MKRATLHSILKGVRFPSFKVGCPECERPQLVNIPMRVTKSKDSVFTCQFCSKEFVFSIFKDLTKKANGRTT
jgi:transposase-like protein